MEDGPSSKRSIWLGDVELVREAGKGSVGLFGQHAIPLCPSHPRLEGNHRPPMVKCCASAALHLLAPGLQFHLLFSLPPQPSSRPYLRSDPPYPHAGPSRPSLSHALPNLGQARLTLPISCTPPAVPVCRRVDLRLAQLPFLPPFPGRSFIIDLGPHALKSDLAQPGCLNEWLPAASSSSDRRRFSSSVCLALRTTPFCSPTACPSSGRRFIFSFLFHDPCCRRAQAAVSQWRSPGFCSSPARRPNRQLSSLLCTSPCPSSIVGPTFGSPTSPSSARWFPLSARRSARSRRTLP